MIRGQDSAATIGCRDNNVESKCSDFKGSLVKGFDCLYHSRLWSLSRCLWRRG